MPVIQYTPEDRSEKKFVEFTEGKSVLDMLLDSGFDIPHGCKAGSCQSCVMQTDSNTVPAQAQNGLKPTQIDQGYFLSCSCYPEDDISVSHVNLDKEQSLAKVIEKSFLNDSIMRLRIQSDMPFKAGQFVNLWRNNTIVRSYSIASTPSNDYLEFHIKRIPNGAFSQWAADSLSTGDTIALQGPLGECYYSLADKNAPLLLSGIGTGLAPLYGILLDALAQDHKGKITLLLGAKESQNFYYIEQLNTLIKKHTNLCVIYCSQNGDGATINAPGIYCQGDIYAELKSRFTSLKGYSVYLCGAESFVKKMKKFCFLLDAELKQIYADAFIASSSSK